MPTIHAASIDAPSSIDEVEIARFSAQADQWWNPQGSFRALHEMGPLRLTYIEDVLAAQKVQLKGARVLDVGCGGGLLAEPMARGGACVVGLDASPESIGIARTHAAQSGLPVDYREGSAEELAKTDERFDVITAFEIVEHVANLKSFMTALAKLLKPEGVLIVATMNRTKRSFLLGVVAAEYVLGWVPAGTHDWDKFVKPSEMVNLWGSLGIETTDISGVAFRPLSRSFKITKGKTAVNYFMAGRRALHS